MSFNLGRHRSGSLSRQTPERIRRHESAETRYIVTGVTIEPPKIVKSGASVEVNRYMNVPVQRDLTYGLLQTLSTIRSDFELHPPTTWLSRRHLATLSCILQL